ncbi:MAG TPA: heavy-metal-associated domain-containing protein [Burkholderiales bacterium]|nr:heavy-metal-associated domain-containing protein [Burkholderiales bacterium]
MIELSVTNMTCGHCVSAVTRALKAVDPEARVDIDLESKRVRIETRKPLGALTKALEQAGYPAG